MNGKVDLFWHRLLKRPYRLKIVTDIGKGTPVVLVHGLGSTGAIWTNVISLLSHSVFRVIAIDLLGFGASEKPNWLDYNSDDHAKSLIASISKLHLSTPPIIVGHSMGCLIAVRLAKLRPDLVRHLILYEMPLYDGLPEKRLYQLRLNAYRSLYNKVVSYEPVFSSAGPPLVQRIGSRIAGFTISEQTWLPFKRSLENTILNQTTSQDLKNVTTNMDVIYGRRDILVIRGKSVKIFGEDTAPLIKSFTINASHSISKSASKFIVSRIVEASKANNEQ